MKYYGSMISHDWDMSFEKFGGLPTVVAFWENYIPSIDFSKNEFSEVPHTIGCKIPLSTVC